MSDDEGRGEDMGPLDGLLQLAAAAEQASKRWVASNEIWTSDDGLKVWPKVRRLGRHLGVGGSKPACAVAAAATAAVLVISATYH
jgi:hypothetical protein